MVSIIKHLTGRTPQSERRPTQNDEGLFISSSPKRGALFGAPKLDLKKYAALNSTIKAQRVSLFHEGISKGKLPIPTVGDRGPLTSPGVTSILKSQANQWKNRKSGTSGCGLETEVGTVHTPPQSVFEDDSKGYPIVRQGILSKAILSRRNSCTASIQVPAFGTNDHRRFSPTHLQINDQLQLTKLLGAGGFGSVYMAVVDCKRVAIKKFHAKTKNEKAKAESFNAESKAKTLRHPNIVRVFGTSSKENIDCVIMEYTGDLNLQQILNDTEQPLKLSRRINYVLDIVSALKFIHENNLVHLDVKPANILVTPYDTCKLGDFGCCQVIENGTGRVSPTQRSYLTGTFAYRAPELLRGEAPTTKADIYSFGITLWQMASGEQPYSGQNQHVVVFGVVAYNLRPESLCSRQLENKPHEQYYRNVYVKCWDANPVYRPTADVLNSLFGKWKTECDFE